VARLVVKPSPIPRAAATVLNRTTSEEPAGQFMEKATAHSPLVVPLRSPHGAVEPVGGTRRTPTLPKVVGTLKASMVVASPSDVYRTTTVTEFSGVPRTPAAPGGPTTTPSKVAGGGGERLRISIPSTAFDGPASPSQSATMTHDRSCEARARRMAHLPSRRPTLLRKAARRGHAPIAKASIARSSCRRRQKYLDESRSWNEVTPRRETTL
jgi:hypothetical protein